MSNTISFGLEGRVVVVTGGSAGIGAACARGAVRNGARVALWDVADAAGQALADELRAAGHGAIYAHCDVASKAEVDASFVRLMRLLLAGGAYPAIATHDPAMIAATRAFASIG